MRRSWHSSAALAPGRSSRRQKTCGEPGFTLWTGLLLACRLGWSSPPAIQMRLPATRPAGRLSASSPRPSEPSDLLRLGCTWQLCRVMGHFCVHTMKTLAYLGPTQEQVLVSMSPSEAYHPGGTFLLLDLAAGLGTGLDDPCSLQLPPTSPPTVAPSLLDVPEDQIKS